MPSNVFEGRKSSKINFLFNPLLADPEDLFKLELKDLIRPELDGLFKLELNSLIMTEPEDLFKIELKELFKH